MVDSLTLYQLTFFTYLEDDGAFDFLLFLRNSIWLGNNYFLEIKFVFMFSNIFERSLLRPLLNIRLGANMNRT